jgi:hypothetical protein
MKIRVLAPSILVMALMSGSAFAGNWAGDVSLAAGGRDCVNTDNDDCGTHFTWGGSARAGTSIGSFRFQADIAYEKYVDPNDENDQANSGLTFGGHLSYRTEQFLIGAFAASGRMDAEGRTESGGVYGAEAQYFFPNTTVYVHVGHADIQEGTDSRFDGWFGGGELRHFINDNFMIHANVDYGYSDVYEDCCVNQWGEIWNYGIGARFLLSDTMPLYGTVDYRGGTYTANTEDDGDENAILFGLSYAFGSTSIKDNDRNGASLNSPMLPSRAASWAQALD